VSSSSSRATRQASDWCAAKLAARAATTPEAVAFWVAGGDDLTFAAWEARSNATARGLLARGVGPDDRVALLFGSREWADFACAYMAVRKCGAAAVLLSPGAASADLARALSHAKAAGLVHASGLDPSQSVAWAAPVADLERGQHTAPVSGVEWATPTDVAYVAAPLAPPRALALLDGDPSGEEELGDGWFVHTWAPGTPAAHRVVRLVLGGRCLAAASLAVFDAFRLYALLAEHGAVACGLTSGLAAALVSAGVSRHGELPRLTRLEVSGAMGGQLQARLAATFPGATVVPLDGPVPPAGAGDTEEASAPVAVSQEPMLWHEQLSPGSFNLPCLVRRYEGPLEVGALEWALGELVRRHRPLRSTFALVAGEPRQVIHAHRWFSLDTVDLAGLPPGERDAAVSRLLADATTRPFDLVTGPLFEPRLVRLGPDDHLLVVRLHHTVFDDWSVDVFRRELSALYAARLEGVPSPLVEPSTTFADFCHRQRATLDGEAGADQRQWWRRELEGGPLSVQLPLEGPPVPGEPVRMDLPPSLAAGLRALAPRLRATPFMAVLAAFSVLVARHTGLDDLVIATVVANRNATDLEPLVGCFTKKVPLRLRVDRAGTFADLVAHTRSSLLGALAHQDVGFDAAVQEALGGPAADHGVVPQVAVVVQGEAPRRVSMVLPGLTSGPFEVPTEARRERHFSAGPDKAETARWGEGIYLGTFLILSLLETPEGMALVARGVFHRPAGRRLLEDFQGLLEEVVAAPYGRVSELAMGGRRVAVPSDDEVDLRGFRMNRRRLEGALARGPGVADAAVAVREVAGHGPRLVAYVVADGERPPSLAHLRDVLWATLPGTLSPAAVVTVDSLVRLPDGRPDLDVLPAPAPPAGGRRDHDPVAVLLAAMWSEVAGRAVGPSTSYWQDFSFLQAVAEAREAGLAFSDEQVARCRTPEMLATALAAAAAQ
jgi:hypothetical protein